MSDQVSNLRNEQIEINQNFQNELKVMTSDNESLIEQLETIMNDNKSQIDGVSDSYNSLNEHFIKLQTDMDQVIGKMGLSSDQNHLPNTLRTQQQ